MSAHTPLHPLFAEIVSAYRGPHYLNETPAIDAATDEYLAERRQDRADVWCGAEREEAEEAACAAVRVGKLCGLLAVEFTKLRGEGIQIEDRDADPVFIADCLADTLDCDAQPIIRKAAIAYAKGEIGVGKKEAA